VLRSIELFYLEVPNSIATTRLLELHSDELPVPIEGRKFLSTYIALRALSHHPASDGILRRINETVDALLQRHDNEGRNDLEKLKHEYTRALCDQFAFHWEPKDIHNLLVAPGGRATYNCSWASNEDHILVAAALVGKTEHVLELLEGKVQKRNPRTIFGTALSCAARGGHHDIIKIILDFKNDHDDRRIDFLQPLEAAASTGQDHIIRLLMERKPIRHFNPNCFGEPFLYDSMHGAVWGGHAKTLILLFDMSSKECDLLVITSILWAAAQRGHLEIVRLMLERGANVNCPDIKDLESSLEVAATQGHTRVVEFLLANGANDIRGDGSTTKGLAIWRAARFGFTQTVRVLIDNGANVEGDEGLQRSLLVTAAQTGQLHMVNFLLSKIDIKRFPEVGIGAIYYATKNGYAGIANTLTEHGVIFHRRPWMDWLDNVASESNSVESAAESSPE